MAKVIAFTGLGLTPDLHATLGAMLDDALRRVTIEFSDLRAGELFDAIAFTMTVLDHPTPQYPATNLTVHTSTGRADVVLVTPAVHPDPTPDGFSRTYDRVWYHKNLIHECTAAFMWHYAPPAPRWPLDRAPAWFIEGLQEFVAIERGPAEARDRYRTRYLPRLRKQTVAAQFANVEDKYADGYLILLFLHDEFGRERVHDILNRRGRDFWDSVERSVGCDRTHLFERWLAWRSAK